MKPLYGPLFFLVLLFTACKSEDKKPGTAIEKVTVKTAVPYTAHTYYKKLHGTIGGKAVVMNFLKDGNTVSANYYYADQGQPIFLFSDWEQKNTDSIYLVEPAEGGTPPRLALAFTADGIKGNWRSGDGKTIYPVVFTEHDNATSLTFTGWGYKDSVAYLQLQSDTPTAQASMLVVEAEGAGETATWINTAIKNILFDTAAKYNAMPLAQAVKSSVKNYLEEYKTEVAEEMKDYVDTTAETHFFLNREMERNLNIIYNEKDYVVISDYGYQYTGGAHGLYGTAVYSYDVQQKKKMELQDVISADSASLQKLIEKQFRAQYHIAPDKKLTDILFENRLPANKNFFFTSKGLGFIYNPYEVAAFAFGEIRVWLPYTILKPHLVSSFATRMNL